VGSKSPVHVKAIVIRYPYWKEILKGIKTIEYRSWRTIYRGWLAIVAARQRESGSSAGNIVCFIPLKDCVEVGSKDYEWMLGTPVPVKERVEIPGRLGLFDVTDKIPETLKSELSNYTIETVGTSTKQAAKEKPPSIHDAASSGDLKKVKAFLEANPKLAFAKDKRGNTPLHYAATNGKNEVSEFLLATYIKLNATKRKGAKARLK
jgi:hypothetical protein